MLYVHSERLCLPQVLLHSIPQTSCPQGFKFSDPPVQEIFYPISDSTTAAIHHVTPARKNEDGFIENPLSLRSGLSLAPLSLLISFFFYHEIMLWVPPPQCLPTGCQPCSHLAGSMWSDSSGRVVRAFPTGTACSKEAIALDSPSQHHWMVTCVGSSIHPSHCSWVWLCKRLLTQGSDGPRDSASRAQHFWWNAISPELPGADLNSASQVIHGEIWQLPLTCSLI